MADDFENAINQLNLNKKIDVEKAKIKFKEEAKVLRKTKNDRS